MTKSQNTTAIEIVINHIGEHYLCFGKNDELIVHLNVFRIPYSVLSLFPNNVKVTLQRLLVKLACN